MPPQNQELPCPQCGTMMNYRLGEYECPQCGHYQSAAQPQEDHGSSGPGFRKQWGGGSNSSSYGGGGNYSPQGQHQSGAPVAPPPPPGSNLYGQQDIYGSYDSPPPPATGTLELEKKIYFGIQAFFGILMIIVIAIAGGFLASMGGGYSASTDPSVVIMTIVSGLIGEAIGLALLYFVLFGDQIWAKWCCGGCTSLSLISTLIGFMIPATTMLEGQYNIVAGIIQVGFTGWFLSILWRDIQARS